MPRDVLKQMLEEEKVAAAEQGTKQQQLLDYTKVTGPREFTRDGVLHAVAKLIATDNQVCQLYYWYLRLIQTKKMNLGFSTS